ncbi:DUF6223 family protein [Saccharothrix hoggarensis]|uniref:DUF6223 family protein n=1 Tax=Saccharothrix hoggarensis TaxID=913853 RepID=A0ABW3QZ33_9PSEU
MKSSGAPVSVRVVLAVAGAALIGGLGLVAPAAAHASANDVTVSARSVADPVNVDAPSTGPRQEAGHPSVVAAGGLGSGRLLPTAADVVGLLGMVLGGLALRSAGRTGASRRGAIAAGTAGVVSAAVGGLHWANSAGGFGTGNGKAGAIIAVVVGVAAVVLAGLATSRARRAT